MIEYCRLEMASGAALAQRSIQGGPTDLDQVAQGLAWVLLRCGSWSAPFVPADRLREVKNTCEDFNCESVISVIYYFMYLPVIKN